MIASRAGGQVELARGLGGGVAVRIRLPAQLAPDS
jgi:hypothetical protein